MSYLKKYNGRIPACGIFCGGCPNYIRTKRCCKGAEHNIERCNRCKSFHLCCKDREIEYCYQCSSFPCARFKRFRQNWLKYGQDMIENQKLLKDTDTYTFLLVFNSVSKEV